MKSRGRPFTRAHQAEYVPDSHIANVVVAVHAAIECLDANGHSLVADALAKWVGPAWEAEFSAALGLAGSWRHGLAMVTRDKILRMAAREFPGQPYPRARKLVAAINRYEATTFRNDVARGERPAGVNGYFYDLLTCGAPALSERSIRRLLATDL
jgi:hypothetical protein